MSDSNNGKLFISTKSPKVFIDMSRIMAIMPYDERNGVMVYTVYLSNSDATILIKEHLAEELFKAFAEYSKG